MDLNLKTMDGRSVLRQSAMNRKLTPGKWFGSIKSQHRKAGLIHQVARLIASGGVSLFRYLINSGLFSEPGVSYRYIFFAG